MKKTFLAMLLLGGTMSMFAQNTGSGSPTTTPPTGSTTNGSTTNGTTNGSTMNGTNSSTTSPTTNGTMNNGTNNNGTWNNNTTQPPTGTTSDLNSQNGTMTNGTLNNTSNNNASWNGGTPSTSWAPETAPSYGWNSYGIWNNYGMNNGSSMNGSSMNNGTAATGSMSSSNSYSAYNGTAVASLPANVQYRFSQDFPANVNNQYSWNQYGDWLNTYYMGNGRLTQYFYDQRGNGYALALPVLQTYVPENVVSSALQKYGSSLYSISMVKTNNGNPAYQIGLIQRGQVSMQYLDENGATAADVWRTEEDASMNSTQSNAAMGSDNTMSNGSSSNMNNSSSDMNSNSSVNTDNSNSSSSSDMNSQSADQGKTKIKIKNADGSETKIKTKDGETKVKTSPATNNNNQQH